MEPNREYPAAPLPAKAPLLVAAKHALDMIAGGASLADILEQLCLAIDAQNPAMMSTVLLAEPDGPRLRPVAGPRVPRAWEGATASVAHCARRGLVRRGGLQPRRVVVAGYRDRPVVVR